MTETAIQDKPIYDNQQRKIQPLQNEPMRPRKTIGGFVLSKTLGRGSMGKVKLATNTETNEKVLDATIAVKIITRKPINSQLLRAKERKAETAKEIRTIREASIMLLLDHPYIAKVYEMALIDNFYYIFMEYVDGGQMLDYIIAHGKLKEKQAREFSRQIASALDYCHRNSIVHRDLKVENILISRKGNVKIIDFGLSNVFSPRSHLSTFCGSLYFAAPELLDGKLYTGPEVDVWSFGIVLYVLVCGKLPFDDPTMSGMRAKVKQGHLEYPSYLSADCKNLLQHMIVTNSKKRATMSEVIVHPWLNKGYDAPVENYLPRRKPLQLPVDINVVHGMRGFQFGSEQLIKGELEFLISSNEYQDAAKNIENTTYSPTANVPTHYHCPSILKRRSFALPSNDPQSLPAAYHPLISIYYLVQERIERNKKEKISSTTVVDNGNATSLHYDYKPQFNITANEPSIGVTYTINGKSGVYDEHVPPVTFQKTSVESSHVSSNPGRGDRSDASETTTASTLLPTTNIFRRWSRRLSRSSSHSDQPPANIPTRRAPHYGKVRPLSQCSPDAKAPISTFDYIPIQVTPSSNTCLSKRFNRFIKRAKSISIAKDLSVNTLKNQRSDDHHYRPFPLFFSNTVPPTDEVHARHYYHPEEGEGSMVTTHHSNEKDNFYLTVPSPTSPNKNNPEQAVVRADLVVKPVLIKGLFSVSTTSTKKASDIRQELIRVLDRKQQIRYREKMDRFECVLLQSKQVCTGQDQDIAVQYSDDDNKDIINSHSDTATTAIVRFEIYIVKIPWLLGMRGVQFRRISGDPWQYKTICSKILDSLIL